MPIKTRFYLFLIWIICCFACVVSVIWMLTALLKGSVRAWNIAVSFDQLLNATIGGDPDETISSVIEKNAAWHNKWWAVILKQILNTIDPGHCERVIELDRGEKIR